MGWWNIKDVATGSMATPVGTNFVIGDEAADAMGDCLDKVNSIYEREFDRQPQRSEIKALFNFVSKARGYKDLPTDQG